MQSVTAGVLGIFVMVIGTGCVVASRSPMAEHVRVCGKLYKPAPSIVVVREEPQWLAGSDEDCAGASLVSPQPKSNGGGRAELSKALDVASLHLKGLPRFVPTGVNIAEGAKGTALSGALRPEIPALKNSNSAVSGSLVISSAAVPRVPCGSGQSIVQTDVYFPRGSQEVSVTEREKLKQLRGRPISYVFIEGLTEDPGLTSSIWPLAQSRAQAVERVVQEVLVPGASIQQSLRAGCCTKQGEPGSSEKDDVGVSVSACLGMVTDLKKGGASSMAR